jgi:hypothetical protein
MKEVTFMSRYEQRITFVQDTLLQHSELDEKAARDLAVHVVYALDHIPENAR